MKSFLILMVVLGITFISVANSPASTTWDEAVQGDLDSYEDLGSLNTGINTIKASARYYYEGETDSDTFYFTIDPGMKLNDLNMKFDNFVYVDDGTNVYQKAVLGWQLYKYPVGEARIYTNDSYPDRNLMADGAWSDVFASFTELGEGKYSMASSLAVNSGDGWAVDYELQLITSGGAPVPVPSTIILLGIGLLGLAGVSRRKK